MKKTWMMVAVIITFIVVAVILVGPIMSNVETPKYDVFTTSENIEVRHYAPMVIAEVEVQGDREEAIGNGFRILADYIFGNNTVQQTLSMTSPVQQQQSQKIAMTAPVQQQATDKAWLVSFVMPSEFTIDQLPKPNDDRVTLKAVTSKTVVAIRFSGTTSKEHLAEHEQQLLEYVEKNQLKMIAPPTYAFYNPPWTLPTMRRHEVLVEIERPDV